VTFDDVIAATEARLGQRVEVQIKERRRVQRKCRGVLSTGADINPEADGHQDDGSVVFQVAPAAWWFRLSPEAVTGAEEERDGRVLRVHLGAGQMEFVIETLS
jgi:hypothetical protein